MFLVIVRYGKSEEYIRARFEPFLHGVRLIIAFGFYIFKLSISGINPDGDGACILGTYFPPHCYGAEEGFVIEGLFEIPCGRGKHFGVEFIVWSTIICLPPIIMITCLAIIYKTVRQRELKISKYGAKTFRKRTKTVSTAFSDPGVLGRSKTTLRSRLLSLKCASRAKSTKKKNQSKSRVVLYKGVAYFGSWMLTWAILQVAAFHAYYSHGGGHAVLGHLAFIFNPLQGAFNLAIYMYPSILSAKRSKRDNLTWSQAFVKAFWSKGRNKKEGCRRGLSTRVQHTSTSRLRSDRRLNKIRDSCVGEDDNRVRVAPQDVTNMSFGCRRRTSVIIPHPEHDYSTNGEEIIDPPVPLHPMNNDKTRTAAVDVIIGHDQSMLSISMSNDVETSVLADQYEEFEECSTGGSVMIGEDQHVIDRNLLSDNDEKDE